MTKHHAPLEGRGGTPGTFVLRALLACLAALLVLTVHLVPPAKAQLSGVGPVDGFPEWYEDANGLRLAGVPVEPDPADPDAPPETVYWSAAASMPVGNGGTADLNMDLIGYYAGDAALPGEEITAATIKVNARGLNPGQPYTITHPYGSGTFLADGQGRITEVLEEAGCDPHPVEDGADTCDFAAALNTSIGPFLVKDPAAGAPDTDGSIGDADAASTVVGSPNGNNFFRIDGPGGQGDRAQTQQFLLAGEVDGVAVFNNLEGGTFEKARSVALAASDSAASIFYTTDGSDPTTSNARTQYTGPIAIGQTTTLKYAASGPAGQSQVYAERYVITPPTSLTLSASPAALPFGQTATLSGKLTSDGAGLAGKPVVLEQKAAGSATFAPVGAPRNTDASGNYSFAVTPNANTTYRASFAGETEGYKASASGEQRITMQAVASTTSLNLSKATVDRSLRQSQAISGQVSPAHAGKSVAITIERYNAATRTFVPVSKTSRVLNAGSAYGMTYKPALSAPLGTYRVTVKFAGDTDHKPSTAVKTFRVIR